MKILILTIFALLTVSLYGQSKEDLILTQEQNDRWFEAFDQLTLQNQVEFLNNRLLADTNIFVKATFDRHKTDPLNGRQVGFCKPIIVAGGVRISIENRTKPKDVRRLTSILTPKTVERIDVLKGDDAFALWGSRGICKAIIISVNGRHTKRKLKKLAKDIYRLSDN
ncbi:hypothetical protein [Parachryseolinea silvisoli]|uniref:hypothetical protein n=1 Tax=Parachryseolinea silvisoli TaxID=2873601 RepID=UPI002265D56D|nr:hypothetical protein [Parachryseolinea silvisoli]MCD9014453.1 hypothetical protein [Parachryseolinea silvisoli]